MSILHFALSSNPKKRLNEFEKLGTNPKTFRTEFLEGDANYVDQFLNYGAKITHNYLFNI